MENQTFTDQWLDEAYKNKVILKNGYVVATWITIFGGIRVVAGHNNSTELDINWCCGNNPKLAQKLHYAACILFSVDDNLINQIPAFSDIKPVNKDEQFMRTLINLIEERVKD